jgi:hypothetical protein
MVESLVVRLLAADRATTEASERFLHAVAQLEAIDMYAAAWVVADSAAELAPFDARVWPVVHRLSAHGSVQQFAPLAARFTPLHDLFERPLPAHGPHRTMLGQGVQRAL